MLPVPKWSSTILGRTALGLLFLSCFQRHSQWGRLQIEIVPNICKHSNSSTPVCGKHLQCYTGKLFIPSHRPSTENVTCLEAIDHQQTMLHSNMSFKANCSKCITSQGKLQRNRNVNYDVPEMQQCNRRQEAGAIGRFSPVARGPWGVVLVVGGGDGRVIRIGVVVIVAMV